MPHWQERLAATADGPGLARAVDDMLAQQAVAWPLLAGGLRGLAGARTKSLVVAGATVAVRTLPHRLKSTTARVDPSSIKARPCFLCGDHLPPEQRGVGWGEEWVVLANPFPILAKHLTIVHRSHTPQRLAGRLSALLELARWLPGFFVIYNGPECGASAPDHLHFQACDRSLLPIAEAILASDGPAVMNDPFRAVAVRGGESTATTLESVVRAASAVTQKEPEPLLNVAAFWDNGQWTAFVFARQKHRPEAFHRGELLVSPAAIDLSGVMVAPREEDFDRMTPEILGAIYDEVMVPRAIALRIAAEARNLR